MKDIQLYTLLGNLWVMASFFLEGFASFLALGFAFAWIITTGISLRRGKEK